MKLNLSCPINTTSYGYVSTYFMKELNILGYDLRHIPISYNAPDENLFESVSHILCNHNFHYDAACLRIWHQHDMTSFTGSGAKIGFPIFELETFSSREAHSLGYPDFLLTPSKWSQTVLKNSGLDSQIVPLGYDDSIFVPCELPDKDITIFGNFGKWEVRKGHDILCEAFNAAFEENDRVLLALMPTNQFLTNEEKYSWEHKYKNSKLGHKVNILPRFKTQSMVYNIMKQIHCAVFPSRAEGWNLEALEALACGRHLIITDCTAHSDFCNSQNSLLIKMTTGYEKAFDGKFFFGDSFWRSFGNDEFDQLVEYMRMVHRINMDGSLQINSKGLESSKEFTWRNSAQKLHQTLSKILEN